MLLLEHVYLKLVINFVRNEMKLQFKNKSLDLRCITEVCTFILEETLQVLNNKMLLQKRVKFLQHKHRY